jgi:hypothetical protein
MTGFRSPSLRVHRLLLGVVICAACALIPSGVALAHGDHHGDHDGDHHGGALFVSPSGSASGADYSCSTAAYSTIQSAVTAAPAGGTVNVCPGTYTEHVMIAKPLTLQGYGATIQASGPATASCGPLGPCLAGVVIESSNVQISGFTVTGAVGEGILAVGIAGPTSDITITGNRVTGNDTGGQPGGSPDGYVECEPNGPVPGDCGEGIHLLSVADSVVSHNYDSQNTGGVLLTDEVGPTHGNLIEDNIITGNQYDCGITVPGHNPGAVSPTGVLQPTVAGDYDNVIRGNVVTNNGGLGEGAGVLFANAQAGTGSYDNLVEGNYIAGNGLSGVTMHAHTIGPGQFEDLSGNTIVNNVIGRNNLDGDTLDGSQSDLLPTGVLVFSATVPVSVTISHNVIFNNHYGIWLGVGGNVSATHHGNRFPGDTIRVFTQP